MTCRTLLLTALCLIIFTLRGIGQGLCGSLPVNTVPGDFEIVGNITSGCSPLLIKLIDKSGGINVKYEFNYTGQPPSQLNQTGNNNLNNAYFSTTTPLTYTILQYGEKNGKPMYACKNITVLPNNQPKFSYTICSSGIEISIPQDPENNFDSYKVNWGSGNAEVTVQANQLPFSASRGVTYPAQINVEGVYNNQVAPSCGGTGGTIVQQLNSTNFPNGYSPPYDPNIEEIVSISNNTVNMTFKGSDNPSGYDLNMRPIDGGYTKFRSNVLPGTFDITLPDQNTVYCFYLTRMADCGSFEFSSEACVMKQKDPVINNGTVNLNWSKYPDSNLGRSQQINYDTFTKKIELEKDYNGNKTFIPVGSNDMHYQDQAECVKNLKYRIKLSTEGLLEGYKYQSTIYSEWKYVDSSSIKAPALTDLFITADPNNALQLKFENNTTWATPVVKYYTHEINNNNPIIQDSVGAPGTVNLSLKDASLQSYCYKISYKDECGVLSELSPEACSIHLGLGVNDILEWTSNSPFASKNIELLELQSKGDMISNFGNPIALSLTAFSHDPDYSGFTDKAIFRLKAVNSSVHEPSYSNFLEVPIKYILHFPNVFTPNGDGINDSFYPRGNTSKIIDYNLKIYDRWGSLVFETQDPIEKWSGKTSKGEDLNHGFYIAKVSYTNDRNETEELRLPLYIPQ